MDGEWRLESRAVVVDRIAEAKLVNMYVNIKKGDMNGADIPGK